MAEVETFESAEGCRKIIRSSSASRGVQGGKQSSPFWCSSVRTQRDREGARSSWLSEPRENRGRVNEHLAHDATVSVFLEQAFDRVVSALPLHDVGFDIQGRVETFEQRTCAAQCRDLAALNVYLDKV